MIILLQFYGKYHLLEMAHEEVQCIALDNLPLGALSQNQRKKGLAQLKVPHIIGQRCVSHSPALA